MDALVLHAPQDVFTLLLYTMLQIERSVVFEKYLLHSMNVCMYACMYVCMYVFIKLHMYVCMYVLCIVITYSRVWISWVRLPIVLVVS